MPSTVCNKSYTISGTLLSADIESFFRWEIETFQVPMVLLGHFICVSIEGLIIIVAGTTAHRLIPGGSRKGRSPEK